MKTKLLFSIALYLSLFLQSSIAQTYTPFPDSNAVWSEYRWPGTMNEPLPCYYRYILKNTDTLINSNTYHKLYYSLIDSSFYSTDTSLKYVGGIRESNKIIYFIAKDSMTEYLLYDFSKHKGDTILYKYSVFAPHYCHGIFDTLIIANIDSIQLLNGTYRMRDSLAFLSNGHAYPCFDYKWIEGIGSTWGLLTPVGDIPTKDFCGNHDLLCFKKDSDIIYHVGYNNNCYLITSNINKIAENKIKFTAYPNPTTNNFTIEATQKATIEIINMQGLLIKTIKVSGEKVSIDVSSFPSGLYLVKIQMGKEFAVMKFIKE